MKLVKNISKILYIGFFLNNADAALPIYPGEILGRDLAYPGVEWLGHVGISLGTQIREQAVGVMEVLNEPKVIQLNSIPNFKSRSRYWGSRYGIAPLDQPFSILRTGLRQRNYCPEYTLLPSWHPGKWMEIKEYVENFAAILLLIIFFMPMDIFCQHLILLVLHLEKFMPPFHIQMAI